MENVCRGLVKVGENRSMFSIRNSYEETLTFPHSDQ